jgi:diacylglycerol kinase
VSEMDTTSLKAASQRKMSFGQTLRAVGWSFFGVRKAQDQEQDVRQLNPIHVIIAGLLAGVLFVVTLVFLVQWVLASGVAK